MMMMSNFSDSDFFKAFLFLIILAISINNSVSSDEILFDVGSNIQWPCNINYPDVSVEWYKDGKLIIFNKRVSKRYNGNLVIKNAKPSDSGNYRCRDSVSDENYSVIIYVQDCGFIPNHEVLENGRDAIKTDHPWNAGIYLYDAPNYIHFCGGTLITPIIVISAAHCVKQEGILLDKNEIFIGLGKGYINYNDSHDLSSAQLKAITALYISPHYDEKTVTWYSDIVLFELETPAKLTRFVQLACIDMGNKFQHDSTSVGTIAGWGRLSKTGDQPNKLQAGDFPYHSKEQCQNYLQQQDASHNVAQDKFCAGNISGDSRITAFTREGDSGSGVIFKFKNKNYISGVVSTVMYNYGVCLFTNVTFPGNLEFIEEKVNLIRRNRKVYKGYVLQPGKTDNPAEMPVTIPDQSPNQNEEAKAKILLTGTDFQAGEDIMIPCYVPGNPSPEVTWLKDEVLLHDSEKVRIFRNNNTLLINNADTSDSGLYKCLAEYNFKSGSNQPVKSSSTSSVYIYVRRLFNMKTSLDLIRKKVVDKILKKMDDQTPSY